MHKTIFDKFPDLSKTLYKKLHPDNIKEYYDLKLVNFKVLNRGYDCQYCPDQQDCHQSYIMRKMQTKKDCIKCHQEKICERSALKIEPTTGWCYMRAKCHSERKGLRIQMIFKNKIQVLIKCYESHMFTAPEFYNLHVSYFGRYFTFLKGVRVHSNPITAFNQNIDYWLKLVETMTQHDIDTSCDLLPPIQEKLRDGYPSIHENLMDLFFTSQPLTDKRKVWIDTYYDYIKEERVNYRLSNPSYSARVLSGKKDIVVMYPSGGVYDGRLKVIGDLAIIEPVKENTAAWVINASDISDDIILSEIDHLRIIHTKKGIELLKDMIH